MFSLCSCWGLHIPLDLRKLHIPLAHGAVSKILKSPTFASKTWAHLGVRGRKNIQQENIPQRLKPTLNKMLLKVCLDGPFARSPGLFGFTIFAAITIKLIGHRCYSWSSLSYNGWITLLTGRVHVDGSNTLGLSSVMDKVSYHVDFFIVVVMASTSPFPLYVDYLTSMVFLIWRSWTQWVACSLLKSPWYFMLGSIPFFV